MNGTICHWHSLTILSTLGFTFFFSWFDSTILGKLTNKNVLNLKCFVFQAFWGEHFPDPKPFFSPPFKGWRTAQVSWLVNLPLTYPPRNKGWIAGRMKGNQWLISPDHKAGYFWKGGTLGGKVDQSDISRRLRLSRGPHCDDSTSCSWYLQGSEGNGL